MLNELIKKEFKDLVRDPRIWIPFIISALILPVMGIVLSLGMRESVAEIASPSNVLVGDLDRSELTSYLISSLRDVRTVSKVEVVKTLDMKALLNYASSQGFDVVVIFWEGFNIAVNRNVRPNITIIDVVKSASFIPSLKSTIIASLINELLGDYILRSYGVNTSAHFIKSPTNIITLTYIATYNQTLPGGPTIFTQLSVTSFMLPIAFMIITVGVLQMAATSTAIENEEKTLEVLLTLPLSRFKILMGKLLGSFAVALIGSALNIAGFIIYFYVFSIGISSAVGGATELTPALALIQPTSLAYLIVSLVLASFAMATLGVTIGVLSSDVRIATTVSSPLSMLIIIPSYYIMFADVSKLNPVVKSVLYAIPFTQPMIMSKELILSRPDQLLPLWLLTSLAFSIILISLTSRILVFEKLVRIQKAISRFKRVGRS